MNEAKSGKASLGAVMHSIAWSGKAINGMAMNQ
jgi:hypothetical protein